MISVSIRIFLVTQFRTISVSFNPYDPAYAFWFDLINLKNAEILWYAE